jgi:hypothetical protein
MVGVDQIELFDLAYKEFKDSSVKSKSTGTVNIPSDRGESGECGLKIVLNN